MQTLIVVRPFGTRRPGDAISEPGEVARVLASEHAGNVVQCSGIGGAEPGGEAVQVKTGVK